MASTLLEGGAAMVGGEGTSEGALIRGKLEGVATDPPVLSPPFGKIHLIAQSTFLTIFCFQNFESMMQFLN